MLLSDACLCGEIGNTDYNFKTNSKVEPSKVGNSILGAQKGPKFGECWSPNWFFLISWMWIEYGWGFRRHVFGILAWLDIFSKAIYFIEFSVTTLCG